MPTSMRFGTSTRTLTTVPGGAESPLPALYPLYPTPVRRAAALVAVLALAPATWTLAAAQSAAPAFTAQQADAGKIAYAAHCASCHAGDLGGRNEAPQLAGSAFMESWKGRTTKDLLSYVEGMPPGGDSLAPDQYLNITAHILHQNGAAPGAAAFTAHTSVAIGSIATGQRPGSR